jgi:signal transduction histidine kinase
MYLPSHFRQQLYLKFIKPVGTNTETYRREFITNIMIACLSIIALLTFLLSVRYQLFDIDSIDVASIIVNSLFLSILLVGWRLSRRGHYVVAASIVVGLLVLATLQLTLAYGFELPIALLLFALSIVMAGILLQTRAAFITTGLLTLVLFIIAYAQVTKRLHPNLDWQDLGFQTGDAVGFVAVLSTIGVVSWLANREIDRALTRALRSEIDLAVERDGLEIKVLERTRELEATQLLRTMELQRFAEFGRLSANLLHEVASPLTAASLNLEQFSGRNSQVIEQARQNIHHIERYVSAARKQLQHESSRTRFRFIATACARRSD